MSICDQMYSHVFHYETECQRIDAPSDGMGEWLDEQAMTIAHDKTGHYYTVHRTHMEKLEDCTHIYQVILKRYA
jgi:hypothetical protein